MLKFGYLINRICIALFLMTAFSSCASIINGTRQKVSITTNPPGAMISDGVATYQTPATLDLKRGQDHILTITKEGHEPETVRLTRVISGAVAGNILAGGLIGWGVDAISGAQWRLEPETLAVNLRPVRENQQIAQVEKPSLQNKLEELIVLKEKNLINEDEYRTMKERTIKSIYN